MLSKADPFSSELGAACRRFEQGHLLLNPFTAYVARPDVPASSWAKAFVFADGSPELAVGGVAPGPEPPFFIILDQTCDIWKTSIPFVHVSPVYNGSKHYVAGAIQRIRNRTGFGYLYPLTAADLLDLLTPAQYMEQVNEEDPDEWAWLTDLRIQIPLDKGVLLDRATVSGFARREDQLAFGRELGHRADRPAPPTIVEDSLIPALGRAVEDAEVLLGGVQFRVIADSVADPSLLELVLITPHGGITAESVRGIVAPVAESVARVTGIRCLIRSCGTDTEVSAADYRDSDLIEIDLAPEG